jgi:hypothetical protein
VARYSHRGRLVWQYWHNEPLEVAHVAEGVARVLGTDGGDMAVDVETGVLL